MKFSRKITVISSLSTFVVNVICHSSQNKREIFELKSIVEEDNSLCSSVTNQLLNLLNDLNMLPFLLTQAGKHQKVSDNK